MNGNGRVSNLLLYCSLGSLIIAFIVFNILQTKESESVNEKQAITRQVHNILREDSEGISEKLKIIVDRTSHISTIEVFKNADIQLTSNALQDPNPVWGYSKATTSIGDFLPSGSGDGLWYVNTVRESYHALSVYTLFTGFVLYWLIFSTWAIKSIRQKGELKVRWAVFMFLLNFIGYVIFLIKNNRAQFSS